MQNAESDLSGIGLAHVDSAWRPDECTTWPGLTVRIRPFRPFRPGVAEIKTDVTGSLRFLQGAWIEVGVENKRASGLKVATSPCSCGLALVSSQSNSQLPIRARAHWSNEKDEI
jgi:hypothetical protein